MLHMEQKQKLMVRANVKLDLLVLFVTDVTKVITWLIMFALVSF